MKWSGAHIWDRSTRPVLRSTQSVNQTLSGLLPWPPKADITVTGTPEQSALIEKAKDLLHYARTQGYKPDELIHLIRQLG